MSLGRENPVEFDLTSQARRYHSYSWVIVGTTIGTSVLLPLYAFVEDILLNPHDITGVEIAIVAIGQAPISGALGFFKTRLSASRMLLDDSGVTFVYGRGKQLRLGWTNPRFVLRLQDGTNARYVQRHPERALYVVLARTRSLTLPNVPLSTEAYAGLMDRAQRMGLNISPPDWAEPKEYVQLVTLRPSETTPGASP